MAPGSTQPLTEMSTRNLPGGTGRLARKAGNLTVIREPIFLDVSELYGPPRPVTGIILLFNGNFQTDAKRRDNGRGCVMPSLVRP
jgi:hypothetical protein